MKRLITSFPVPVGLPDELAKDPKKVIVSKIVFLKNKLLNLTAFEFNDLTGLSVDKQV